MVEGLGRLEHRLGLLGGAAQRAAPVEAHGRLAGDVRVDHLQEAVLDRALRHVGLQLLDEGERLDRLRAVEGDLELVGGVEHAAAGGMQQRGEVVVGAEVAAERHAEAGHVRLLLRDGLGGVEQVVPVPGVGILEPQLLGDVHAHEQEVRLMMGGNDVLLALPGAPVFPLHAVDEAARADLARPDRRPGVSRPSAISCMAIGDSTLISDGGRRAARSVISLT